MIRCAGLAHRRDAGGWLAKQAASSGCPAAQHGDLRRVAAARPADRCGTHAKGAPAIAMVVECLSWIWSLTIRAIKLPA